MTQAKRPTTEVMLAFRRRLLTLQPGDTLRLRLQALTFSEAAQEARAIASRKRWSLAVRNTTEGIELLRGNDADASIARQHQVLDRLQPGQHEDFQVPTTEQQRFRVSVSNYARRSGLRVSIQLVAPDTLRVIHLEEGQQGGRRLAAPEASLEVQRQAGTRPYPWEALDAPGKWFRVYLTEQWDQRALTSLCANMRKNAQARGQAVRYSVRFLGHQLPPEQAGHAIVRTC